MRYEPFADQADVLKKLYQVLSQDNESRPLLNLPTGSGKSLIAAEASGRCVQAGKRVIQIVPSKELVSQNADQVRRQFPGVSVGIYCAGLGRRDVAQDVVIGSIQSIYKKATEFIAAGRELGAVIVDECHLISKTRSTMYQQFLESIQEQTSARIIGMTATPYRLSDGVIVGPGNQFTTTAASIGIDELIRLGRLSPMRNAKATSVNLDGVKTVRGDFEEKEMSARFGQVVQNHVGEILATANQESRRSVLVFCSSVENAIRVRELLAMRTRDGVGLVTGKTPGPEREKTIDDFRQGRIRFLVNVGCLTTGFDVPRVDLVAMLRATKSPGLFAQIAGRGLRKSPGKSECLLLDFGGNVSRHGPLDSPDYGIASVGRARKGKSPFRVCPGCKRRNPVGVLACLYCPHEFKPEPRETVLAENADTANVLGGKRQARERHTITDASSRTAFVHKYENGTRVVRFRYRDGVRVFHVDISPEFSDWRSGFSRRWFQARSNARFPRTVERLLELENQGAIAQDRELTFVKSSSGFWNLDDMKSLVEMRPDVQEVLFG